MILSTTGYIKNDNAYGSHKLLVVITVKLDNKAWQTKKRKGHNPIHSFLTPLQNYLFETTCLPIFWYPSISGLKKRAYKGVKTIELHYRVERHVLEPLLGKDVNKYPLWHRLELEPRNVIHVDFKNRKVV